MSSFAVKLEDALGKHTMVLPKCLDISMVLLQNQGNSTNCNYTHCFAHRSNLCLQDSTRINPTIRASLELCSQIAKLCRSSGKTVVISESFMNNLSTSQSVASIKPICLTTWTVNNTALH